jgi:hypothetical protein
MKIFFPLEVFYPSQAGGPANSIYWLTKNLVKEGFEPIIVASDKGIKNGFPLNRWIENEAGRVIHVRTRSLRFPVGQTVRSLLNFYRADVAKCAQIDDFEIGRLCGRRRHPGDYTLPLQAEGRFPYDFPGEGCLGVRREGVRQ